MKNILLLLTLLVISCTAQAGIARSRVLSGYDLTIACAALSVYYESDWTVHPTDNERRAIAFVVKHRMLDTKKDSCDVTFKKKQFSWTNKALDENRLLKKEYLPKGKEWQQARVNTKEVLSGEVLDFTHGADHYHAVYIKKPKWTKRMVYVGTWGLHRFYRSNRANRMWAEAQKENRMSAITNIKEVRAAIGKTVYWDSRPHAFYGVSEFSGELTDASDNSVRINGEWLWRPYLSNLRTHSTKES